MSGSTGKHAEQTIARLARAQHGVVTRVQLLAAGIASDRIDRQLGSGRLVALQKGVYLTGPVAPPLAHVMSSVLACGNDAAASFRSAATLWQLQSMLNGRIPSNGAAPLRASVPLRKQAPRRRGGHDNPAVEMVDVTVPPGLRRHRPGVRVHRMRLSPDEVTTLQCIPVTTPTRTLFDLAGTIPQRDLERAVAEALTLRLTSAEMLAAMANRYEGRAGSRRLAVLADSPELAVLTRSEAEERFLALIRAGQLPAPGVNVRVQGYEVDFFWTAERFVVEIDGFVYHSSRDRFESDRRRDSVLAAAGVRVMRLTWRQIEAEPHALLVRLAQALTRAGQLPRAHAPLVGRSDSTRSASFLIRRAQSAPGRRLPIRHLRNPIHIGYISTTDSYHPGRHCHAARSTGTPYPARPRRGRHARTRHRRLGRRRDERRRRARTGDIVSVAEGHGGRGSDPGSGPGAVGGSA